MKIGIEVIPTKEAGYYIVVAEQPVDYVIAGILGVDLKKYQDNLVKYGAYVEDTYEVDYENDAYFKNEEDAKRAVEEYVLPLYIAKKLGG